MADLQESDEEAAEALTTILVTDSTRCVARLLINDAILLCINYYGRCHPILFKFATHLLIQCTDDRYYKINLRALPQSSGMFPGERKFLAQNVETGDAHAIHVLDADSLIFLISSPLKINEEQIAKSDNDHFC